MGNEITNTTNFSSNPLVTVIIPVYNVEEYLRQCLDSVLAQTYKNLEVILVDDGSTDSSIKICQEYCDRDERFKLYKKENGGASSARNLGLEKASGDYLFFLDSDDWIDVDAINKMVHIALHEDVDFVFSEAIAFDDKTGKTYLEKYSYHKQYLSGSPQLMMNEMMANREFHLVVWSILFSRAFFENNHLRFVEGIMSEDVILIYQIYMLSNNAAHLHEPIYHRRYRINSVTTAKKTEYNFISAATVYYTLVEFNKNISKSRQNQNHIIRCAFNALNIYRELNPKEKASNKMNYENLVKDIKANNYFGSKELEFRCKGYVYWLAYKMKNKIIK